MALHSLCCADMPLRNCALTHLSLRFTVAPVNCRPMNCRRLTVVRLSVVRWSVATLYIQAFCVCVRVWLTDLVVRFYGCGHVSWSESQTTYIKGSAPTVSCRNTETYLDHSLSLINKGTAFYSVTNCPMVEQEL